MSANIKENQRHDGVVVSYKMRNARGLTEVRQVRFINNQIACDWLTDQWPTICSRQRAWLIDIRTDIPVHYPDYNTLFKDTPHV